MPSARRVSWAKLRVTAVALAGLTILTVLLYLLTGGTLFQRKSHLTLHVPDVTGLAIGAAVRVDGIGVGKVASVALSGSNDPKRVVRVVMTVEAEHLPQIPADSWAQLTAETLIGDKFVDITSGKSADHFRDGGEIPYKEQLEMMKSLDLTQFEQQLREIDAMISEVEQGRSRVGKFVKGDEVYKGLLTRIDTVQAAFKAALRVTSPAGAAVYTSTVYQQVQKPLREIDQTLARLQSGQGGLGLFLRDDAQYQQTLASLRDLQRTVADVEASDFIKSDLAYRDWNRGVAQLIRAVDEFNASAPVASSDVYESVNGMLKEARDTLKDFRQNPRKYLRLKVF